MTDEQKSLFDLQGYLKVEGALSPVQMPNMIADLDAHDISNLDNDSHRHQNQQPY